MTSIWVDSRKRAVGTDADFEFDVGQTVHLQGLTRLSVFKIRFADTFLSTDRGTYTYWRDQVFETLNWRSFLSEPTPASDLRPRSAATLPAPVGGGGRRRGRGRRHPGRAGSRAEQQRMRQQQQPFRSSKGWAWQQAWPREARQLLQAAPLRTYRAHTERHAAGPQEPSACASPGCSLVLRLEQQ